MSDVTQILSAIDQGDPNASEKLLPLVYDELRRLAAIRMARESAGQTLQPTALVHEAWLRLNQNAPTWKNRAHFFGAASEAMRRILIESARRKASLKHGGGQERINIDDLDVAEILPNASLLLMNDALERLKVADPEVAQIVMLKFFAGLSNEQIVEITGSSDRTVRRQWAYAKAWLLNDIEKHR